MTRQDQAVLSGEARERMEAAITVCGMNSFGIEMTEELAHQLSADLRALLDALAAAEANAYRMALRAEAAEARNADLVEGLKQAAVELVEAGNIIAPTLPRLAIVFVNAAERARALVAPPVQDEGERT